MEVFMKQLSVFLLASIFFFGVTSCREVYDPTDQQVVEETQEGMETEQHLVVQAFTPLINQDEVDQQTAVADNMANRMPMRQAATAPGGDFFAGQ